MNIAAHKATPRFRRAPPELLGCPCGAGRPVIKLNARRRSFDKSLWCPACGLTAHQARSPWMRASLWNNKVRYQTAPQQVPP